MLDAEELPEICPDCGARDPWVGPFVAVTESEAGDSGNLLYSPFYMAAVRPDYRSPIQ